MKKLVEHAESFAIPKAPFWRPALTLVITIIALLTTVYTILIQQTRILSRAKDALCAGDTSFVYGINGMGTPAWSFYENPISYERSWPVEQVGHAPTPWAGVPRLDVCVPRS